MWPVQQARDQGRFALLWFVSERQFVVLLLQQPLPAGFTTLAKTLRG
jgi:hypothetical protein